MNNWILNNFFLASIIVAFGLVAGMLLARAARNYVIRKYHARHPNPIMEAAAKATGFDDAADAKIQSLAENRQTECFERFYAFGKTSIGNCVG